MKKIVFYDKEKSFIRGLERYVAENEIIGADYNFFNSYEKFSEYMGRKGKTVDLVVCPQWEIHECSSFGKYKMLTLNFDSLTSEISKLYSCTQVLDRVGKELGNSQGEARKVFFYDPYFILNKNRVIRESIKYKNERVLILDFTLDYKVEGEITKIFDFLYQVDWNFDKSKSDEENGNEIKKVIDNKIKCDDGNVFYYKICETKYDLSTVEKEKLCQIASELFNINIDKIVIVSNCDVSSLFIELLKKVEKIKVFQAENSIVEKRHNLSKQGYYEMINSNMKIEFIGE